jgi:hypothetical protein
MVNVPHNNQMSVHTHTCIVKWDICYRSNWVHVLIQGAECIMHDIDQCKISVVPYSNSLVYHR